ncbi:MAG: hypothetical protein ACYSRZ_02825 [Planctomycetota bacterium]|jgi:hypothetical protein
MAKTEYIIRLALICSLVSTLFIEGCISSSDRAIADESTNEPDSLTQFLPILFFYVEVNGDLPDSIEDIKTFCFARENMCSNLDLAAFSLKKLEDGKVEIEHKGLTVSFPITLIKIDPEKKTNIIELMDK